MAFTIVSSNFTRPANTTQYADNDIVSNDTDAADFSALSFEVARAPGGLVRVLGARLHKSDNDVTGAVFRLHLWTVAPTPTNGDNGALADATGSASYLGYIPIDMSTAGLLAFGDGNVSWGSPVDLAANPGMFAKCAATDVRLYGALQAKGTYTPASEEVFTVTLFVENQIVGAH